MAGVHSLMLETPPICHHKGKAVLTRVGRAIATSALSKTAWTTGCAGRPDHPLTEEISGRRLGGGGGDAEPLDVRSPLANKGGLRILFVFDAQFNSRSP